MKRLKQWVPICLILHLLGVTPSISPAQPTENITDLVRQMNEHISSLRVQNPDLSSATDQSPAKYQKAYKGELDQFLRNYGSQIPTSLSSGVAADLCKSGIS